MQPAGDGAPAWLIGIGLLVAAGTLEPSASGGAAPSRRPYTGRPMRRTLVLAIALAAFGTAAAPAQAANVWTGQRVLNMAHQGGEDEAPSNTMYALRRSLAVGADMLELDVHTTRDGRVVVLHDSNVDRTTNGTGSVYEKTLAQIQALDSAYNFIPGRNAVKGQPESAYPFRGVRTGKKKPPAGYTADDFRIPTLDEVMAAFPKVPLNVEIKGRSDQDPSSFMRNAELLAGLLKNQPRRDIIVVSFYQPAVDSFHAQVPDMPLAPGVTGNALFVAGLPAGPGVVALQVPPTLVIPIVTPDYVRRAHASGYAVHVWFSGQEESRRVYESMLDMGVDGLMPAEPLALEKVLCERRTPRPQPNPNHCGQGLPDKQGCALRATRAGKLSRAGRVRISLARPFAGYIPCSGRVAIESRRGKRTRVLGRASFVLPAGTATTTATVRLSKAARRLVPRGRRGLRARVPVRVAGRAGVDRRTLRFRR